MDAPIDPIKFNSVMTALVANTKNYMIQKIKYIDYNNQIEYIFKHYGLSREEFFQELDRRHFKARGI